MMSTRITTFFMAISLLIATNFAAPKADAIIGLVVKKKVVKVIGGIGMGVGGSMAIYGLAWAATSNTTGAAALGTALGAAIITGYGIIIGAIGLLVLDDHTVVDMEFVKVNKQVVPNFSEYDIAVYNSEIEELNAVRKSIQVELSESDTIKNANALWVQYRDALSPQTAAIAEAQAANFVRKALKH